MGVIIGEFIPPDDKDDAWDWAWWDPGVWKIRTLDPEDIESIEEDEDEGPAVG